MTAVDDELEALATEVGRWLTQHGWLLATAESCTGGWISTAVTAVAGSSDWFDRGFVTYSYEAKEEVLGVARATLERHGAVSEAVVRQMATGALTASRADIALAVSGIAGPGGATADKPVGTVCFAWARRDGAVTSETLRFDGDRRAVRLATVRHALGVLAARIGAR
ncbi:CinA family protein [Pseudazoarcus pumilus]|uniref:Damage-inducible protein CinA n=1 Tax=Pseudazoarcus pumilus TaxID=2067960 RepID=A0A2I6S9H8_9RHOO|nr:nicotinamide-nucleotide amidohydrolase family protein [Pseudazoarcus pumilus]AUN95912.1 damage-inducible protein CinA [Pseudazoarcus pumilus]